jgi:hypothetical protein
VLTDQNAGAAFAGREVVVTGALDRDGQRLQVASIRPAS